MTHLATKSVVKMDTMPILLAHEPHSMLQPPQLEVKEIRKPNSKPQIL